MAGNQLNDLFTRNVLLLPTSPFFVSVPHGTSHYNSLSPHVSSLPSSTTDVFSTTLPTPSPLDMVAQLLPALSVCTTVPMTSIRFPTGWEVRGKIFPKYTNNTSLPLYINFTVHSPSYGDQDSGRFYIQSSLGHILGIVHVPHISTRKPVVSEGNKGSAALPISSMGSTISTSSFSPISSAFFVGTDTVNDMYFDIDRTYQQFYDEAVQVFQRHALPSSSAPHPRLLVVLAETSTTIIDELNGTKPNPYIQYISLNSINDFNNPFCNGTVTSNDIGTMRSKETMLIKDLRTITSSIAYDIIQQLMEDARITASGGNDNLVHNGTTGIDPSLTVNTTAASASVSIATTFGSFNLASCFTGIRGGGVDVALTTGLSSVTLAMGGAKRRLQTRLLRRRGDAALLAGSPHDALEMYDKAAKSGRAATDEIGLALIAEGKAAALFTKYILDHSTATYGCPLTDVPYLPEIATSLREAVLHIDNACNQSDIRTAFEGIYGLSVTLRLRLCHYLFTSPTLPKSIVMNTVLRGDIPIDSTIALGNEAFRPFYRETTNPINDDSSSLKWMQQLQSYPEPFDWGILSSSSLSSSMNGTNTIIDRGNSNGKSTLTGSISAQLSSGSVSGNNSIGSSNASGSVSPALPEILDIFATTNLHCALVRPTTHQIRCLLGTAGVAYRANIKRKGEVLLLRAARLLRSIQHTIPSEWHNQLVTSSLDSTGHGEGADDTAGFIPSSNSIDSPRKINRLPDIVNSGNNSNTISSSSSLQPASSNRGGCIYEAVFSIQPITVVQPIRPVASSASSSSTVPEPSGKIKTYIPSFSSVWPWPWMHSSCMLASRTLPLAMRFCAPTQLSGCLCIAAGGGAELLNPYRTEENVNISSTNNYHRSPVSVITRKDFCRLAAVDFYMCGDLSASLAMISSGMITKTDEEKTVSSLVALPLPTNSEILHSLASSDPTLAKSVPVTDLPLNRLSSSSSSSSPSSSLHSFEGSIRTGHLISSILTDVSSSFTLLNSLWHRQTILSVVSLHSGTYAPSVLLSTILHGFRLGPLTTWARLRACMHVLGSLRSVTEHAGAHLFHDNHTCCSPVLSHPDTYANQSKNNGSSGVSLDLLPIPLRKEYSQRKILFESIHRIMLSKEGMCIAPVAKSIFILMNSLAILQGWNIHRSNILMNSLSLTNNEDGNSSEEYPPNTQEEHHVMEMSFSDFAGDNVDNTGNVSSGPLVSSDNAAAMVVNMFSTFPTNTTNVVLSTGVISPNGGINENSELIIWHTRDITKTMGEYLLRSGNIIDDNAMVEETDKEILLYNEEYEHIMVQSITDRYSNTSSSSSSVGNRTESPKYRKLNTNGNTEEERSSIFDTKDKDRPIVPQIHTVIMPTVYGSSWIDPIFEQ